MSCLINSQAIYNSQVCSSMFNRSKIMLKKGLIIGLLCLLSLTLIPATFLPSAEAANPQNGSQIFSVQCAGCHANGGNIIRRGKNLKQRALKRNKLDSLPTLSDFVANGKRNMPAYKDRLTPEEIEQVSAYILEQAATGW